MSATPAPLSLSLLNQRPPSCDRACSPPERAARCLPLVGILTIAPTPCHHHELPGRVEALRTAKWRGGGRRIASSASRERADVGAALHSFGSIRGPFERASRQLASIRALRPDADNALAGGALRAGRPDAISKQEFDSSQSLLALRERCGSARPSSHSPLTLATLRSRPIAAGGMRCHRGRTRTIRRHLA